ncbi:MAG: hypothetical protein HY934_02560, partial [Candidatus Firestonebacteria bacterium]|nr:hypothetical protein [Candidatus Firestonebacteria bacterium]
ERLTIRGGLQYIIINPSGNFDHWTPLPFVKIGKLDEENLILDYKKAILGGLNFSMNYRFERFEFIYGIGQLIPIEVEERFKKTAGTPKKHKYNLDDLWNDIKNNPGGNNQGLKVILYF